MSPRTGRPKADSPKNITIRCRIDTELNEKLEAYCKDSQKTKTEVMIEGIKRVLKINKE